MKKLITPIAILISSMALSQDFDKSSFKSDKDWNSYVKVGYALHDFTSESINEENLLYVEAGKRNHFLGFSGVFGRANMTDSFTRNDSSFNYFVSVNATLYYTHENFQAFILGGLGSYFKENSVFPEYGFGIGAKVLQRFDVTAKVHNHNNKWFISPTIGINL